MWERVANPTTQLDQHLIKKNVGIAKKSKEYSKNLSQKYYSTRTDGLMALHSHGKSRVLVEGS